MSFCSVRGSLRALLPLLALVVSLVPAAGRAQGGGKAPYVDLGRARAVADGAVLFGTDGLHRHVVGKGREWGAQGRDAAGYGHVAVEQARATLRVTTEGDERGVALTARAVGKERAVRVLWDGKPVGDVTLDGTWRTASFPLTDAQAKAGRHTVELRSKGGTALPAEAVAAGGPKTELLLHALHLLLRAPAAAAAQPAAGPVDGAAFVLLAGERARFHLPLAAGTELWVTKLAQQGGAPAVRVDVTPEGAAAATTVAQVAAAGGRWALPDADGARILRLDLVATGDAGRAVLEGAALAAPPLPAPAGLPAWTPPRNAIVWVIDTLRADRLSHLNPDSPVKTPNIDRFAAEGTTFTQAIQQGNYSKETACSLFAGTYNDVHGCHSKSKMLPRGSRVMQDVARAAGLKTAGLVSNGFVSKRWGYDRGWDAWHNYIVTRGRLPGLTYDDAAFDWGRGRVRGVRGEAITRDSAEWVRLRHDEGARFFLYIQTVDPHTPYRAPREFWEPLVPFPVGKTLPLNPNNTGVYADSYNAGKFTFTDKEFQFFEALYLGEIAYTDFYFGKLMDALKKRGVLDETMVIITADHGEGFREHEAVGHGTLNLYEEVIHVPLIVRYPGGVPAGRRIDQPVEVMDTAPTVAAALGQEIPAEWQAGSLLPLLRGPEALLPPPAFCTMSGFLVTAKLGRYKIIRWRDRERAPEVYDLVADPKEKRDLVAERPWLTRSLNAYLDWYERVSTTWKRAERGALGDFRPLAAVGPGAAGAARPAVMGGTAAP